MKNVTIVLCLFLTMTSVLMAQSSPALDPNYITLEPTETFKGYYASTGVGATIQNIGLMTPQSKYGDVFLNCVDTFGYGDQVALQRPLGLFQGGSNLSLFNRAKFTFNNSFRLQKVFSKGKDSLPLIIADSNSLYRVHYPIKAYDYTLKGMPFLAYKNPSINLVGYNWGLGSGLFNNDSREDIVGIVESGDSTAIGIWHGESLEFMGDTVRLGDVHYDILPDDYILKVFGTSLGDPSFPILFVRDLNRDGIPDLIFLCDTLSKFGIHGGNKKIAVVFGKRDQHGEWQVDTSLYMIPPFSIKSMLSMDFLWSDGVPDLILGTDDTIFCYSGAAKNFLRVPLDWYHPDLAIPSPAKLDAKNFNGNGHGKLWDWSAYVFDAGNVNGSGDHSLATLFYYQPDTSSLYAPTYCFLYSGGRAADEKADALFADNSSPIYEQFTSFDTIQDSQNGIMGFFVGDNGYTAGGNGIIYHFNGLSSIPHNPDSRWTKGVVAPESTTPIRINLMQNPVRDVALIEIESDGWSVGTITVRDLLGRNILTQNIFISEGKQQINLNLTSLSAGVYVIGISSNFITISTKTILIH